jgi:hypothetical protein
MTDEYRGGFVPFRRFLEAEADEQSIQTGRQRRVYR